MVFSNELWKRPFLLRCVRAKELSGLSQYELELAYKLTGSAAVAREIRARLSALGTFMRDDHGHLRAG